MIACLSVITSFAYTEFECGICADARDRQADNNPYIKMFIFAGWGTMIVDAVSYGILLFGEVFAKDDEAWMDARSKLEEGMEAM